MLGRFSRVQLLVTLWTVAHQAPLSENSLGKNTGVVLPPPEDLPNPGIEPASLMFPEFEDGFFTTSATWEAQNSA